jgi:hypothetical protein
LSDEFDEDEEDQLSNRFEDDEIGLPKNKSHFKKSAVTKSFQHEDITYRKKTEKRNQLRQLKSSMIEKALEIDMPSISTKVAQGIESKQLNIDPISKVNFNLLNREGGN